MLGELTSRPNPPISIVVYENKLNATSNDTEKPEAKNAERSTERAVGSMKSPAAECTAFAELGDDEATITGSEVDP